MTQRSLAPAAVLGLGLALTLGACGLVTRPVPDEFTVVAKAPLVVPPDFGLRPPMPGAPQIQSLTAGNQAQAALAAPAPATANPLFGAPAPAPTAPGAPATGAALLRGAPAAPAAARGNGEAALLARTNATNADPNIRAVIDLEAARVADRNNTFIRRILFWQRDQDPTINPTAEAERLRTAANAPAKVVAPPTAKRTGGLF